MREAVRYQMKYGADLIKFCATGGALSARDAALANGLEGIKTAVRAGVLSIEHGSTLDEEAVALMKRNDTYLVPTMMAFQAVVKAADEGLLAPWSARKTREIVPHFQRSIRLAITEELNIAFSTDAGSLSMSPLQAILAATREAATLLGAERELGTVEPGKKADLVAVTGDPLQEIELLRTVDFVMRAGIGYKSDGVPRI